MKKVVTKSYIHVARLLKRDVEGRSVEYDGMVDKEERRDGRALNF